MMILKYLHIARQSLKQRRGRSFLTILGIVFGIGSITLLINFGLGAQQQILHDNGFRDDLLTVRSGQTIVRDQDGNITQYNFAQNVGVLPTLTVNDFQSVQSNKNITKATPIVHLNEEIKDLSDNKFQNGHVIAANEHLFDLIDYKMALGHNNLDKNKLTVIIGDEVARELFNNSRPIAHEIVIGEYNFIVVGVLQKPIQLNLLNINFNYRRAVIMPFETLQSINNQTENATLIYEILAQTEKQAGRQVVEDISEKILENHRQKQDFAVFKNNELVFLTRHFFQIFRNLTIIISILFLTIGGIGLMNAMQASIAERKLEISIRKAVGATNQQILNQFLVEALLLSKIGGFLGISVALFLGLLIDYWTPIQPVIQIDVIILMLILAPAVGLIFGSQPAIQAALQQPGDNLH